MTMRRLFGNVWLLLVVSALAGIVTGQGRAELIELGWYRLGEEDPDAAPGAAVEEVIDSVGINGPKDYFPMGSTDPIYSDDTPPGSSSTLSVELDGENWIQGDVAQWWNESPLPNSRFRVGMEAFVKLDPSQEDELIVPFGGAAYGLTIDRGEVFLNSSNAPGSQGPGVSEVEFGQWQHLAFLTTGSFWQAYVNGEPQFDPELEFTYGGGDPPTIGADRDGLSNVIGLVDEFRVFTWSGPFDRSDLLYFSLRQEGDVNEDGVVDDSDYDIWRMHVGDDVSGLPGVEGRQRGDLNIDGVVNLDDFAIIKANLTPVAMAATSAVVPEPTTCALLVIGLALGTRLRRRAAT
jgi:hypothetical protein